MGLSSRHMVCYFRRVVGSTNQFNSLQVGRIRLQACCVGLDLSYAETGQPYHGSASSCCSKRRLWRIQDGQCHRWHQHHSYSGRVWFAKGEPGSSHQHRGMAEQPFAPREHRAQLCESKMSHLPVAAGLSVESGGGSQAV